MVADRGDEVPQRGLGVLPAGPPPLLGEVVPRAAAVTVAVRRPQQRLGGVDRPAAHDERSDRRERHDLRTPRKVTGEPPWPLVFDHRLDQVRTTNREVDGDHRPGARADHDGGRGPQALQERRGIGRMRGDPADRLAAGAGVPPAVVGDHSTHSGEFVDRRAPGRGRRPGRVDQEDRDALACLLVVEVASDRAHRTHPVETHRLLHSLVHTCFGTCPAYTNRMTLWPKSAVGGNIRGQPPSITVMPCWRPNWVAACETLPAPGPRCIHTWLMPRSAHSRMMSSAISGRVPITTAWPPPGIDFRS